MRVRVQRRLHVFVSEALRDDLHGFAAEQEQCRAGVPNAVELDAPQRCGFGEPRKGSFPEIVRLQRMAQAILPRIQVGSRSAATLTVTSRSRFARRSARLNTVWCSVNVEADPTAVA